jgi:NAD(P)-dependent dehydrogenase (short-subunit alcohol dehydrogenase family)
MGTVVITGSTRGIGWGLAQEFRKRGWNVVVSGRTQAAVVETIARLQTSPGSGGVAGAACQVADPEQVQGLWDAAAAAFGRVDIWINNAGVTGPKKMVWELSQAEMQPVIDTNLWGSIHGTRVPLAGMTAQGAGKIFNFEGFGSDGMSAPGLTMYGTTKRAIRYFHKAMVKELKGSPVMLGVISPGIVITDLITDSKDHDPAKWEKTKKFYNILADKVETVAPFIVEGVIAASTPGAAVRWLTTPKAIGRFLMAPFRKRDLFA